MIGGSGTWRRYLKRAISVPLLIAASVFLAVEELQWRLAGIWALLGRLPLVRVVERWLESLPPWAALLCFALPAIALAPFKLLALYWMAGGRPALGIGVILAAKILGTAFVARLFQLTRGSLLQLNWFRRLHDAVLALREAAYRLWRETAVGRWLARRTRTWWTLRMAAARRFVTRAH